MTAMRHQLVNQKSSTLIITSQSSQSSRADKQGAQRMTVFVSHSERGEIKGCS